MVYFVSKSSSLITNIIALYIECQELRLVHFRHILIRWVSLSVLSPKSWSGEWWRWDLNPGGTGFKAGALGHRLRWLREAPGNLVTWVLWAVALRGGHSVGDRWSPVLWQGEGHSYHRWRKKQLPLRHPNWIESLPVLTFCGLLHVLLDFLFLFSFPQWH